MPEEKPAPAESGRAATGYSYPGDIARFVRDQWRDALGPASREPASKEPESPTSS
jgi:hypothetical protein